MEQFPCCRPFVRVIHCHRWIPFTKASDAELCFFLWFAPEQTAYQTVEMLMTWDAMSLIVTSLWWELRQYHGWQCPASTHRHVINTNIDSLQWRNKESVGVSSHRRLDCLLNHLFWWRSKKISKHCVTGLCEGNPPVIGGFPSQRASNAENASIW